MITTIHRGINEKGRVLILLRGWAADKTGVQIQEDAKKMYIEEAPVQVSMLTTDGAEQDMLQTTLKAEGRTDSRAVRTMSMKAGIQAAPAGGQRQRVMTMVIIEECRRMMIIREILRKGKSVIQ